MRNRSRRTGGGPWGVVLLALIAACSAPPARTPPDVVLVTIDTLRADHLGAYGAGPGITPAVDELAAAGTLFENAASSLPETRPSHFTIFTSLEPPDHGVLGNSFPAPPGLVALPALYREAGYEVAGFAGCALFDEPARLALGFDVLDAPTQPQRNAAAVVTRAIEWLERVERRKPVFLWVHLFDPHMPYEPPPGYDPDSAGTLAARWPRFTWPGLLAAADRHGGDLPAEVLERARSLYRGEVRFADAWLGRLRDRLRELGRWESAIVLLTADHGECFADGVYFDHSQCLAEGSLRIPLILRAPSAVAAGRRVGTRVGHVDVAPTLLRLSGLPVPEAFRGEGLLRRADRGQDDSDLAFFQRPLYRESEVAGRNEALGRLRAVAGMPTEPIDPECPCAGVRSGWWKFLRDQRGEALYDLRRDPGETSDLTGTRPERSAALRAALEEWLRTRGEVGVERLDPELVERLRSLGYL